jgi:hypothetical protein
MLEIRGRAYQAISVSVDELKAAYSGALEAQVVSEVVTA